MIATGLVEESVGVDVDGSCFISTSKMAALIKKSELRVAFTLVMQAFFQWRARKCRTGYNEPSLITPAFRLFLHHELDELII